MKTLQKVTVTPVFVHYIPSHLEEKHIYISKEYNTASHLCLCGCMELTVTPLGKGEWSLIEEDNGTCSFIPSISNYQLDCKSHYIITKNIANFV